MLNNRKVVLDNRPSRFILRSEFLTCLSKVYEDASTDYLLALRDGLSLLILKRVNPSATKPLDQYEGYVKYV